MKYKLFLILTIFFNINAIKIDRVILSTDNNPDYIEFWPIVAKVWKNYIGFKPTLALIADETVRIDESLGEVIKFKPIPGIPTSFYAQVIRLLLPSLFENDVCLISDIDMIPLNKNYFTQDIKHLNNDSFVVFQNGSYEISICHFQYPMCYNASLGKNFKEIFQIKNVQEIEQIIKKWYGLNLGWSTDQLLLYKYLAIWKDFKKKCILLGHYDFKRVDKLSWHYSDFLVQEGIYVDAHCPRPYKKYKEIIDRLVKLLPLK